MSLYAAWSQDFLPEGSTDLFTCFLEEATWRKLHDRMPDAKRIFASIQAGERTHVCALGHPVRGGLGSDDDEPLYLSPWLLQSLRLEGAGDEVVVNWITEDFAPEATKIVLRPHESAFYQANARDELEPALTRYGILRSGSTVPVPLDALGGYVVLFDVMRCEPADLVLMEGDEVEIEFEQALDYVVPSAPIAPPIPSALEPEPFDPNGSVLPAEPSLPPTAQGHILGGQPTRARLPDGRPWNPWRDKSA